MSHFNELLKARSVASGMTVLVFTHFVTVVLVATVLEAALAGPPPASPSSSKWKTLDGLKPHIYAHRGEPVLMPEETIPAYEVASILGAEYVETDLVLTKDNRLVCHHDLYLSSNTDVQEHPQFDHLIRRTPDGSVDWYVRDFTLAELKTLKVVQQKVGIRPEYLNYFGIPTFEEFLDTVHRMTFKLNRTIGIIPELKSTDVHNALPGHRGGVHGMEQQLLDALAFYGYPITRTDQENCSAWAGGSSHMIPCPPVILQCFQLSAVEYLRSRTNRVELIYLAEEEPELLTYKGMERVARVVHHYVTWKDFLYHGVEAGLNLLNATWNATLIDSMGGFVKPSDFLEHAHKLGMKFGVYTIYDSRETSSAGCPAGTGCDWGSKQAEMNHFLGMGVDSLFVENVAESRELLLRFEYQLVIEKRAAVVAEGGAVTGSGALRLISISRFP